MRQLYFFIVILCAICISCDRETSIRKISLKQKGYYEVKYQSDTITINSIYPLENESKTGVTTLGKAFMKDGEYFSCEDKNLFMSVKKDTSFVIVRDLHVPEKMYVYIGLAKNAPSNINIPKSEKIDGRYVTKYYTDEERMNYAGYEYYYDKKYTIMSIRYFTQVIFEKE